MSALGPGPAPAASPVEPPPTPLQKSLAPAYHSKIGLSLGGGTTSGIGIGIRKHFASRWGISSLALPVLGQERGFATLGVQGMYSFLRTRVVRLYALFGAQTMYFYNRYDQANASPPLPQPGTGAPAFIPEARKTMTDPRFLSSVGPGLGVELHFSERFSWSLDLPVATIIDSDKDNVSGKWQHNAVVLPIPNSSITLYY